MSAAGLTPERWDHIKQILHSALELNAAERGAWLDRACAGDESLRREVDTLIAAHEQASGFLDTPIPVSDQPLSPGRRIGNYQVVQLIGEGGMGSVYQALREDIRKLVAIKVVKRGFETEFVLSRFANERQILAHFDHPYITKFLDSGITADGRPYFVMEFIAGDQIDRYCDSHGLTTRERLQLVQKVCSGVEYAHRNLVIHRDLKPRNILVTEDGDPKLLDFGIAKIIEENPVTGEHSATVTVVRMMTPEYASPEQARGDLITTASDVYSLGVLLYELLTGHHPYRLERRSPAHAAEVICRVEPLRPSVIVRRTEPADPATGAPAITPASVSAPRDGSPARLTRALAGDLDNIILKALQKQPERRYGSVEQLAADIQRHLDGLPVLAREASWRYRAGKFIRRHKAGAAAAAVVIVSLAGGFAATLREARIAEAHRIRAERRFQDVRNLAGALMFEVYDAIQDLPGSTAARELLVKRARLYLDSLSAESAGDPGLRRELAMAYERVGDVQGGYRSANLGNTPGAVDSYRKALELREALAPVFPADLPLRRDLVRNHGKLSDVLLQSGNSSEAIHHSRKLLDLAVDLAAHNPASAEDQGNLAAAYLDVGWKQAGAGDWQAGLANSRKSMELFERLAAGRPGDAPLHRRLVIAYNRTGMILASYTDRLAEALAIHRKELAAAGDLAAAAPLSAPLQRLAAYARIDVGTDLSLQGDFAGARPYFDKALAVFEQLSAADPKNVQYRVDVAHAAGLAANAAIDAGDPRPAIGRLQSTLAILQSLSAGREHAAAIAANQFRLGKAWLRLALLPGAPERQKRAQLAQAGDWYRRSLPGLEDGQRTGSLQGRDVRMIESAREGIRQCEEALAAAR